jgi:hypothetical protein
MGTALGMCVIVYCIFTCLRRVKYEYIFLSVHDNLLISLNLGGPQISSANRKSVKFANFKFFWGLRTIRKWGNLSMCDLRTVIFFLFVNLRFGTTYFLRMINFRKLGQFSDMAFRSLNILTYRYNAVLDQTTLFFLVNFRVAIRGLGHQGILRIFDLQINHYECADLKIAYSHSSEFLRICVCWTSPRICVCAINGLTKKIRVPPLVGPQKQASPYFKERYGTCHICFYNSKTLNCKNKYDMSDTSLHFSLVLKNLTFCVKG